MTDIALRTYNQEIKDLIDHGHFDEAIAHCQHILETFPKHIETYRLLGKAFLEQTRHGDAADVFQRVLSVVPDDWISHVAMAIVREDESNLDMAIWHMERAYEVNPSNGTVQQEIRRLRGRRDGVEPPKLRLTRAALARMYIKGGLYPQAVAEIRGALAEDPDRPDLQVLLATALYESNSLTEAAEICNAIVKKLPYCLDANRLLGMVLWNTNKQDEAEKFFQRLVSLDPYIDPDAFRTTGRMGEHPLEGILLTRLEWEQQLKTDKTKQPSWAASLGIKIEEPKSTTASVPDWLSSATQAQSPSTPLAPKTSARSFSSSVESSWMGSTPTSAGGMGALASSESGLPDWLSGGEGEKKSPFGVEAAFPAENPIAEAPKPADNAFLGWTEMGAFNAAEPSEPESLKGSTGDLPDWVTSQAAPEPSDLERSTSLPDWLSAPATPIETAPPRSTANNALPDWIGRPSDGQTPLKQEQKQEPIAPASTSSLPDWLSAPTPPSMEPLPATSLPEWVQPEQTTPSQPVETPALPDWLSTTRPREDAGSGAEPDWLKPIAGTAPADVSIPDWMTGIAPAPPAGEVKAEEVPDWLKASPSAAKPSESIPEWMKPEAGEPAPVSSAPAWMSSTPTSEEIPEWMKPETPSSEYPATESASSLAKKAEPIPLGEHDENLPIATKATPVDILQDWFKSSAAAENEAEVAEQVEPAQMEAVPSQSLPDWLSAPSGTETDNNAPSSGMPDWLTGAVATTGTAEPAAEPIELSQPEPLDQAASPISDREGEKIEPAGALPDWLTGSVISSAQSATIGVPSAEEKIEPGAVPDWITGAQPSESVSQARTDANYDATISEPSIKLPDWLRDAAAPPPEPQAESIETHAPPMRTAPSMPDWVRENQQPPMVAGPTPNEPISPAMDLAPAPIQEVPVDTALDKRKLAEQPEEISQQPISTEAGRASAESSTSEIDLPDWLSAKIDAQPAIEQQAPPPAMAKPSATPLPDWLKAANIDPNKKPVLDWDTAAKQAATLSGTPAEVTKPTAPLPSLQPASGVQPPVKKTSDLRQTSDLKPIDPVARWLDRRLKTSTLRSLDETQTKGVTKPSETSAPQAAKPAGSTQLPTWLDYQRPGASDTVVQWIDRRAPTGRLTQPPPPPPAAPIEKEKIPTKPLVKTSIPDQQIGSKTAIETPQGQVAQSAPYTQASAEMEKGAIPSPESAVGYSQSQVTAGVVDRRSQVSKAVETPSNPPSGSTGLPSEPQKTSTLTSEKPGIPIGPVSSKSIPVPGEEEEGDFVPPPEWLQKALGSAVSDVPPVPKVSSREPVVSSQKPPIESGKVEQTAASATSKPPIPAKVPKYEEVIRAKEEQRERGAIPAQSKRLPTQPLSDFLPSDQIATLQRAPSTPAESKIWTPPPAVEEPAPSPTAAPSKWVPIDTPKRVERPGAIQTPVAAEKTPKAPKKRARKLTEVEAEAVLKEARVYLESDIPKAAEAYKRILDLPTFAEIACKDLQAYLEQDPDSAQLWNLLGDALGKAGNLQEAYRAYEEALKRV